MIMPGKKTATMNESTSVTGHFDGHGGATVQYCIHRRMNEVQGFHKTH